MLSVKNLPFFCTQHSNKIWRQINEVYPSPNLYLASSAGDKLVIFFFFLSRKNTLAFHANCLLRRHFTWSVKACFLGKIRKNISNCCRRPRWLSWMRHPTGDQEVADSTPAEVGNILSWRLIMKYFLRSFSPFHWFKKGSCQFLAKECAQYWLTA